MADDEWEFFEVEESPAGGHREAWAALVRERPELALVAEWDRRVDVVCGRDGISRHRFACENQSVAGASPSRTAVGQRSRPTQQ